MCVSFLFFVPSFNAYSTSLCSPFIWDCLTEFYSTYDDTLERWNGAELLSRVGKSFMNKKSPFDKQMELKLQPSFAFFPISRDHITRYVLQYAIWLNHVWNCESCTCFAIDPHWCLSEEDPCMMILQNILNIIPLYHGTWVGVVQGQNDTQLYLTFVYIYV